jgi:plasmid stabilization system protein ParE
VKTRLTAPARQQVARIDLWWREHRPTAPGLFARELAEAQALLAANPEVGTRYTERHGVLVRRVLPSKTHQHVYYQVDSANDLVLILAVWGAPRGRGPRL